MEMHAFGFYVRNGQLYILCSEPMRDGQALMHIVKVPMYLLDELRLNLKEVSGE